MQYRMDLSLLLFGLNSLATQSKPFEREFGAASRKLDLEAIHKLNRKGGIAQNQLESRLSKNDK